MKTKLLPNKVILYIILFMFLLQGCAEVEPIEACVIDEPYGFFGGLWHGIIAPISFILSLFFGTEPRFMSAQFRVVERS